MYLPYQFMSALEDDRLRTAARDGRAAAARREHRRRRRARRDQRPGRRPEPILSPPDGRLTARRHRTPLQQEEP